MATLLDISLLQKFDIIFPFIFVFVAILAIFGYLKLFENNKAIHALAAITLAFSSTIS